MTKSVSPFVTMTGVAAFAGLAGANALLVPVEALAAPTVPLPQQPATNTLVTDIESLFGTSGLNAAAAPAPAQALDLGGILGSIFGFGAQAIIDFISQTVN